MNIRLNTRHTDKPATGAANAVGGSGVSAATRRLRRTVTGMALTAALLGAVEALPAEASTPVDQGTYVITTHDGLAVDVSGASTDLGAAVIEWPVNGGANQSWFLTRAPGGAANAFWLQNSNSGQCLAVNASSAALYPGAPVIQFTCLPTATTEIWYLEPFINPATGYVVTYQLATAADPSYVLDVPDGTTVPGTQFVIKPNEAAANQMFYFTAA